jgi:hypothetical protein
MRTKQAAAYPEDMCKTITAPFASLDLQCISVSKHDLLPSVGETFVKQPILKAEAITMADNFSSTPATGGQEGLDQASELLDLALESTKEGSFAPRPTTSRRRRGRFPWTLDTIKEEPAHQRWRNRCPHGCMACQAFRRRVSGQAGLRIFHWEIQSGPSEGPYPGLRGQVWAFLESKVCCGGTRRHPRENCSAPGLARWLKSCSGQ